MRTRLLFVALVLATSALSSAVNAGVPDPRNSVVPTCLTACPNGDLTFTVIVRDVNNAPLANNFVQITLCSCSSLVFCPGVVCNPSVFTNAAGEATFAIRMGGTCPNALAEVSASGVVLSSSVKVRTLDFDGSLVVDGGDVDHVPGHFGESGSVFDVDCAGGVDQADQDLVIAHKGHTCDHVIPAISASWGTLKAVYR